VALVRHAFRIRIEYVERFTVSGCVEVASDIVYSVRVVVSIITTLHTFQAHASVF